VLLPSGFSARCGAPRARAYNFDVVNAPNVIRFPLERTLRPVSDPVLARMKARGLSLTRITWLELAFPDGAPDPLPAEVEASIPEELR